MTLPLEQTPGEKGVRQKHRERADEATRDSSAASKGKVDHDLQPLLGVRLRELRNERGIVLAEVAKATGISRSFLSLLENGLSEITIGRLVRIMQFYGVHVGDFLETLQTRASNVVRLEDRQHIPLPKEHLDFFLLATDNTRTMLPMVVEFQPGGATAEAGRHPGEEFIHVLEGEILLELEGEAPTLLRTGDTAWFRGDQGHTLTNPNPTAARAIAVISPPNM